MNRSFSRYLIGLFSIVVASLSHPNDDLKAINRQLTITPPLQSEFIQTKKLAVLPQPLISEGYLTIQRNNTLHWHTTAPLQSTLTLSNTGIQQSVDGSASWSLNNDKAGITTMNTVIHAVLSANWQILEQYFELEVANNNATWVIALIPKDATLASVFEKIEMAGSNTIQSVHLFETNNTQTAISFSNTRALHDDNLQ